ncbi:MAG: response regulator [Kiritimatiellae bacterium]|nr:response regulator [Kiritimatiellia bacterium]MDD4736911.1 response regulator [Kiritimatiellia bacterium]
MSNTPGSSIRFLSVDDSFSMRRVIEIMLKRCGITQLYFAKGGREAIDLVRQYQYDAVFCDWNMPDVCGLEVVKAVRELPNYDDVPIMMCTSERFKREVVSAVSAGANNYIVKPFQINVFRRKLADMLEVKYPELAQDLRQQSNEQEQNATPLAEDTPAPSPE